MKTHNKCPQWDEQPLRLNKEQLQNPIPVIDEFFDTFPLNVVRETLWEWMVEVVSSPRGISNDARERGNHIFFYETIETLVEAAFVLGRKATAQKSKKINRIKKTKTNEKKNIKKQ